MSVPLNQTAFENYLRQFSNYTVTEFQTWLTQNMNNVGLNDEQLGFLTALGQRLEQQQTEYANMQQQGINALNQTEAEKNHYEQMAQNLQNDINAKIQEIERLQWQQAFMSQYHQQQQQQHQSQSQQNNSRSVLAQALQKSVKPPTFNGDNVIDWIFKINQYLNALDENATTQEKVSFASTLLVGRAGKWWRYKVESSGFSHVFYSQFKDFTDDIYSHFIDIDHLNILREKADTLTQKPKQPVQQYITKFKDLQVELGPYAMPDADKQFKFMKGLNTQIRVVANLHHPQTFDQACQAAIIAEKSLLGTLGMHVPSQSRNNNYNPNSDAMDLGLFTQSRNNRPNNRNNHNNHNHNNRSKGKQNVQNRGNDVWKKEATCHHCGKKGHIKPDCYSYQRQQQSTSSSSSRPHVQHKANNKPRNRQANLAEQVAQLTAELAALKADRNRSKN